MTIPYYHADYSIARAPGGGCLHDWDVSLDDSLGTYWCVKCGKEDFEVDDFVLPAWAMKGVKQ